MVHSKKEARLITMLSLSWLSLPQNPPRLKLQVAPMARDFSFLQRQPAMETACIQGGSWPVHSCLDAA
eukprot:g25086.t1